MLSSVQYILSSFIIVTFIIMTHFQFQPTSSNESVNQAPTSESFDAATASEETLVTYLPSSSPTTEFLHAGAALKLTQTRIPRNFYINQTGQAVRYEAKSPLAIAGMVVSSWWRMGI
ncbi:hypothetical protein T439DRAFT_380668 [Meredithblackwellia eburnea MCA 4105]